METVKTLAQMAGLRLIAFSGGVWTDASGAVVTPQIGDLFEYGTSARIEVRMSLGKLGLSSVAHDDIPYTEVIVGR